MKPAKIMLVGAVGSGKTTLIRCLNQDSRNVTKTQSIEYQPLTIDTPGEFMENPYYYRALFATSLESDIVVFVQDATRKGSVFPPGFAGAFARRTVGVVSKIDHPDAQIEKAVKFMQSIGLNGPLCCVSALTGQGMRELTEALNWI